MRINVYAEELRPDRRSELFHQAVRDEPGTTYSGVRIYLGPDNIHRDGDDDTSALNLFVPRDRDGKPVPSVLKMILLDAVATLDQLATEAGS